MDHFLDAFRNYANFSGRATRTQYWMFSLFMFIICFGLAMVEMLIYGVPVLVFILLLGAFVPSLAIAIRRLHDSGRSGWWYLISFVPYVGGIVLLVFMCLPSVDGGTEWDDDQVNEF